MAAWDRVRLRTNESSGAFEKPTHDLRQLGEELRDDLGITRRVVLKVPIEREDDEAAPEAFGLVARAGESIRGEVVPGLRTERHRALADDAADNRITSDNRLEGFTRDDLTLGELAHRV